MLCLNDNTPYSVKADELCAYDALRAIANRPVKDIVDSHGNNLLIYPHSFRQSKDKIGSQSILSWQTNWKVTMFAIRLADGALNGGCLPPCR